MNTNCRTQAGPILLAALLLELGGVGTARADGIYSNSWVHVSETGNLLYRRDEHGVRICDFSDCGYKRATGDLPDVYKLIDQSRWIAVAPAVGGGGSLDADHLQNAINAVSQMTVNSNGFRGVVSLTSGDYLVNRTLLITNSGVVLKGLGSRGFLYTTIRATANFQHTLLSVTGAVERSFISPKQNIMINPVVPAGARTFKLFDTADLAVGNSVLVTRPFTANWISAIDMDKLRIVTCFPQFPQICYTNGVNWDTDRKLVFERQITHIDGQWVTVDSPLPATFDLQYGGGFVERTSWPERLQNIGVEDIYFDTTYSGDDDEDHGWVAVEFKNAENVWVRDVYGKHFGMSLVSMSYGSRQSTVAECQHQDPISKLEGNRRYPFHMEKGDHHLMRDCYSDDGRHDFAFGSLVPGPNANVRCRTHESHADSGPHFGWSVGGLYDLISLDASWGADFLGKVGINVQNRGRNTGSHGWAGAYMAVWNCFAPNFRVRNPPTARNWLIGSIGFIEESQWWLPPVGDDPAGTYESSGPAFVPPNFPVNYPLGHPVEPYSLYFAQLHQRLRWPASDFREYWVGDVDDFGDSITPDDTAPVDPVFLSQIQQNAGTLPVIHQFDSHAPEQQIAFTFTTPLSNADHVVAASLTLCMKATGPSVPDDMLFIDNPNVGIPLRTGGLGWEITQSKPSVQTLEIDPALLADGKLNVSIKKNVMLDWAVLDVQVSTVAVTTQALVAIDDTYVRGGTHKSESFGSETQMWVKNEDDGDNSRKAYIRWSIPTITRPLVGATVRLFCNASAQPGNVYYAAVTIHDDWGESGYTWNNQVDIWQPIAYFVPKPGQFVDFSLLPQFLGGRADVGTISIQIWAPYDLGDAGFATFATREDPDPARRPQIILQYRDEMPSVLALTNQAMIVNTQLGPLPLTVFDKETPASALQLFAASSNPALVPSQNIVFGGSGGNRTYTITPLTNQTGLADITIMVSDGLQTNSQRFTLRVGLPSNPLVISAIPDQILSEHTASPRVPFTITDSYGRANEVQISVNSLSSGRIPKVFSYFGSDDPAGAPTNTSHRYVVFTPNVGFTGVVNLTFQFSDGFNPVQRPVQVTVNPVDDPPGPIHVVEPDPTQVFLPGQPITLEAIVGNSEGDLARVEFHNQEMLLGTVTNAPYRLIWPQPPEGDQSITAVAADAAGQRTESAPVVFQIGDHHESPAFLAIQRNGDAVDLSWDADGRNVQLQQTAVLAPNTIWSNVVGTVTNNSITVPRSPMGARYFRLSELP